MILKETGQNSKKAEGIRKPKGQSSQIVSAINKNSNELDQKQSAIRMLTGKVSERQLSRNEMVFSDDVEGDTKMYFKDGNGKLWEFAGTLVEE